MWYLIISIIAMFVSHIYLYAYYKSLHYGQSYSSYMGPGVVLLPFVLGLAWPISLTYAIFRVIFKKYLKTYYDRLINWLAKHLFTDL